MTPYKTPIVEFIMFSDEEVVMNLGASSEDPVFEPEDTIEEDA